MSERFGKLEKAKARLEARAAVMADVVKGLTVEQSAFVEHVTLDPRASSFGSEALLLLEAPNRRGVPTFLALFPPLGLDRVEFRAGGSGIVPTLTRFKTAQLSHREVIVPFLYHVTQTRKVARHTVTWITALSNGVQVTIECDVVDDSAAFALQHMDDMGHNQVLFRRTPNSYVPDGPRLEQRGTDWSPIKDVTASVTIWWPYSHPKFTAPNRVEFTIPDFAAIALEVSQEALD